MTIGFDPAVTNVGPATPAKWLCSSTRTLLCTDDANLMRDFKTKAIVDRPRGRIYTCSEHDRLLREVCSKRGAVA